MTVSVRLSLSKKKSFLYILNVIRCYCNFKTNLVFRNFLYYMSAPRIGLTNPNCSLKTVIICDRSEPTVDITIVPSIAGKRPSQIIVLYQTIAISRNIHHTNILYWIPLSASASVIYRYQISYICDYFQTRQISVQYEVKVIILNM